MNEEPEPSSISEPETLVPITEEAITVTVTNELSEVLTYQPATVTIDETRLLTEPILSTSEDNHFPEPSSTELTDAPPTESSVDSDSTE